MTAIRTPKSIKGATTLCERYAALSAQADAIEATRNAAIARANADADAALAPVLKEGTAISARLQEWWPGAAGALTGGKRKSVQLGGCMVGTKSSSASLTLSCDEGAAVKALQKDEDLAEGLLRTKVTLDRPAILKSLDGLAAKQLLKIGFGKTEPADVFFVKAVAQDGTIAGAGK